MENLGLGATGVLLVGLVLQPRLSLNVLWNGLIPLLPALFLLNPLIWRNVCPLATLTMWPRGTSRVTGRPVRAAMVVGAMLLFAMIMARRVVFNTDGPAVALAMVGLALLALAGGLRFEHKAGFCNTICPVLPVERLYGQRPLLAVKNLRCQPCVGCTARGCLDRSRTDAIRTVLGPRAATTTWLLSPFGGFAAAFPGLIVGYFTSENTSLAGAPAMLGHVMLATASSMVMVWLVVRGLRISAAVGMPMLAALAAALYYWYSAAAISGAWHLPSGITWAMRVAALMLIATWLARTPSDRRRTPRVLRGA